MAVCTEVRDRHFVLANTVIVGHLPQASLMHSLRRVSHQPGSKSAIQQQQQGWLWYQQLRG
jgi:hypothetical protein